MKTRAKQTMDNTRDIINNAVAGQVQEVLGLLPSEDTIRRDIRRNRQAVNQIPPVPQPNNLQFVLPQRYCITTEGDQFLQVDSFANHSRKVLIFREATLFALPKYRYVDNRHWNYNCP